MRTKAAKHARREAARIVNRCAKAFTLVELMVVMAIIAIAVNFAVPAVISMLFGSELTRGGQALENQLALARQTALSTNHTTEVRFYQFSDPSVPGETVNQPSTGQYRAVQIYDVTAGNVPLTSVLRLPTSIVIDPTSTYSSLISGVTPATSTGQPAIPQAGTNYNAVSFRFAPNGATNLVATGSWFLTLRNGNDHGAPPKNFVTIQVDPTNGHVKTFRP